VDYVIKSVAVSTTAASVLDAAEFDRSLVLAPSTQLMFVGFDSTNMGRLQQTFEIGGSMVGRPTTFVLPAGKELWAMTTSGTHELNIIATATVAP
jgi:hypothetical protein